MSTHLEPGNPTQEEKQKNLVGSLGALLFLVVLGVFLPTLTHGFITYDDPVYVLKNTHVTSGVTARNIEWAFNSLTPSYWNPLTWVSHMVDCQLYGLNPWGHHLTSVVLHALNALLLFLALREMTGALWRSLLVAALFGLHPLHIESVAWIAERKDVLSTAFFMLTLWAYARRYTLARTRQSGSRRFYGLALASFALGLMSKPMLVTLPGVLLLLDFWPLRRWEGASAWDRFMLLVEKLPFFACSAVASLITLTAQSLCGAVATTEVYPLPVRIAHAMLSYCGYLKKCFVPVKLSVFYPYFPGQLPFWPAVVSGAVLTVITLVVLVAIKRRPYLAVGWFWFLGTLVPVIGLVQVGAQGMADRYSYVPLIGVFIMGAWLAGESVDCWPKLRRPLVWLICAALLLCTVQTSRQLSYWKDGKALFRHAIAVTENNWVAHANLFATLSLSADPEAKIEERETQRILADFAGYYVNKGVELGKKPERAEEAIKAFRSAIDIMPELPEAHFNLGLALAALPGKQAEALSELRTAVRLRPDFVEAHYCLGTMLLGIKGAQAEAYLELLQVVKLRPAHYNMAYRLSMSHGRVAEAISEYQTAVALMPDSIEAHYKLGLLLAIQPDRTKEAIAQFEAVLRIKPDLQEARDLIERLRAVNR